MVDIVKPALEHLPSYKAAKAALERGWSPDNVRLMEATREQLAAIAENPIAFLASLDDPEGKGPPIALPDGRKCRGCPASGAGSGMARPPARSAFAGSAAQRRCRRMCLAVVPWKRGRGYATEALRLMLGEARAVGLPFVEITAKPHNPASHKVILANGGRLVGRFFEDAAYGGAESLRFRIDL